jgi:chromatin modification-related protein EAF6
MSFPDDLAQKQNQLESELEQIEKQIYDMENSYLCETANTGTLTTAIIPNSYFNLFAGNVITGFENYFSTKGNKQQFNNIKRFKCNPKERIFSLSSITSPAVIFPIVVALTYADHQFGRRNREKQERCPHGLQAKPST